MYEPRAQRLPCGCYGRCCCHTVAYIGLVAGVVTAAFVTFCFGILVLMFAERPWQALLWFASLAGLLLAVELILCAITVGLAALLSERRVTQDIWGVGKFWASFAAGTLIAVGTVALGMLALFR